MEVNLTAYECSVAGQVGFRRNLESIFSKRKPRFSERYPGELFGYHIMGAIAEIAVAKCLGRYWGFHENQFGSGDLNNLEVRYSKRNDLKVRERDEAIIVSVTGDLPTLSIAGWIEANEAKLDKWKKSPRSDAPPAYFVPHGELNPIESIVAVIGR